MAMVCPTQDGRPQKKAMCGPFKNWQTSVAFAGRSPGISFSGQAMPAHSRFLFRFVADNSRTPRRWISISVLGLIMAGWRRNHKWTLRRAAGSPDACNP